jgi:hypothetical protein
MRRVCSVLSVLFGAAGCAAFLGAFYLYYYPPADRRVDVQEPEREIVGVQSRETLTLVFAIRNPTWHTARVVGLAEC